MGLNPAALPDFPWDSLAPYIERAKAHPDGLIALSVGTPVDPTPEVIRRALAEAADAPGYPATHGTRELREAIAGWYSRRRGVPGVDPDAVLPTIGSKEFVAWLPALLGLGENDAVVVPTAAYPTYEVGATLAGATTICADDLDAWRDNPAVKLVWLNSPSNPTGAVATREHLAEVVAAVRNLGAVVASDECYAELSWSEPHATSSVPSVLDPLVCGDSHHGILAVYSLSKQSNLAGYRAAFTAGDAKLVADLLEARKHAGMLVPGPVQAAMIAALMDDAHVVKQREVYRNRRDVLSAAIVASGMEISHSEAGLYLWATRGEDCWATVERFADQGIVVAPGAFYGAAGQRHVRIAITASDASIDEAARRLGTAR